MVKPKVLEVSVPLLVSLVCVGLVTAAPAGEAPGLHHKTGPDLVIQKVTLPGPGGDEQPERDMLVTIKNIGNGPSGPCSVVVLLTSDVYRPSVGSWPFLIQRGLVPKLDPNATCDVNFLFVLDEANWRGMCLAAVDPPVEKKPCGQVDEWPHQKLLAPQPGPLRTLREPWTGNSAAGEHNNGFAFAYALRGLQMPFVWTNPAVP